MQIFRMMRSGGRGAGRRVAPSVSMSAIPLQGVSSSSQSTLKVAKRHWEAMRTSAAELATLFPKSWDEVDVVTATNLDTYARFAFYLFNYKKNAAGDTLDASSIINYTSALLNDAKNRFNNTPDVSAATSKFFECLIVNSTADIAKKWCCLKGASCVR